MRRPPQQTVKLAIDCDTGELVTADSLLSLSEVKFSELRRSAMEARNDRKRGGASIRFVCAICKQPLFLSRHRGDQKNRWFVHDGKAEECPWYEHNRLAPDQIKALIYRGQQEGVQHQKYKQFLAYWLERDPAVSDINLEQTTFGETAKGEWRRPDVKCYYKGLPLVFEVQLSYTFLSDVIARDKFYKSEGIYIIWVFASFDLKRAAVADEAFFNHRNLFVLDAEGMRQTENTSVLTFSGYHQNPIITDRGLEDIWVSDYISLNDVTFPLDTLRPYFFDYDAALIVAAEAKEQVVLQQLLDEYIDLALRYYDSGHSEDARQKLLAKGNEVGNCYLSLQGAECLRDWLFYGEHGVLSVLLSIKLGRPISYRDELTVFRVIEAGLRSGRQGVGKHAYAILYLWAYKIYRPNVTDKNRRWLSDYAGKIKYSLDSGEIIYRRYSGYDEVISKLFPELSEKLATNFGCL